MLVVALVHSRLDYGNSVLIGLPANLTCQLPASIGNKHSLSSDEQTRIYRLRTCDHITDKLISLHWLQVPEWIQYKLVVLVYKALHAGTTRYLSSLVHVIDLPDRRALRSVESNSPLMPPFKLSTVGGRAFPVVAVVHLWNRLPILCTARLQNRSHAASNYPGGLSDFLKDLDVTILKRLICYASQTRWKRVRRNAAPNDSMFMT